MTGTPHVVMRSVAHELFMALLTLLSTVNLALVILPFTSSAGKQVVLAVDTFLLPIFLADFLLRLASARSRREYLLHGWGWTDLLAVVPLLRVFRLLHVAAVFRSLRSRGPGSILEELSVARAAATFYLTIFLVVFVLEMAGALVLSAEAGAAGANITTPGDALWWGYVTITTVGYGDQYPVTPWGRVIGVFLLTAGVALFSVFTGFIANAFLAPRRLRGRLARAGEPGSIRAELDAIRLLLAESEDRSAALRTRLDALERGLVTAVEPAVLVAAPRREPSA
ncbi:MAG: ion transporter [Chloroflexi bacterium]|jgi:voltage-gated potassium channel|nr:ion transporter [Chloroflexota bacterium]